MVTTNKVTSADAPKTDVKSGTVRDETVKILGGYPKFKTVEQISDECSPTARKRAPGAAGF